MLIGPAHVDFNITNRCNLACSHCHSSSGSAYPDELDLSRIKSTILQLHDMGVLSIAFAGGEPFSHPDILEILRYACSLSGWRVSVITNGFYAKPRVLDFLREHCPKIVINISLDGSNPEGFSTLRKQKNVKGDHKTLRKLLFDTVVQAIKRTVEYGFEVSVNFTITKATICDLLPTYRLAVRELGASSFVAIKFFPGGFGKEQLDQYELPYQLWSDEFSKLTHQKLLDPDYFKGMQISVPSSWEFYLPLIEHDIDLADAEQAWGYKSPLREQQYFSRRDVGDVAGYAELCVDGDGHVYPSVLYAGVRDMSCGNVKESTVTDIWQNSPLLNTYRSMGLSNLASNCRNCKVRSLCGGGSRARAYSLQNCIYAADSMCPIVKNEDNTPLKSSHEKGNSYASPVRKEMLDLGSEAIRFYFYRHSCEIRFHKTIINCSSSLSQKLKKIFALGEEKMVFSSLINMGSDDLKLNLTRTLRDVAVDAEVMSE